MLERFALLRRYAHDFEDLEVNIDTLKEEQEAAEEEAEEEDDQVEIVDVRGDVFQMYAFSWLRLSVW